MENGKVHKVFRWTTLIVRKPTLSHRFQILFTKRIRYTREMREKKIPKTTPKWNLMLSGDYKPMRFCFHFGAQRFCYCYRRSCRFIVHISLVVVFCFSTWILLKSKQHASFIVSFRFSLLLAFFRSYPFSFNQNFNRTHKIQQRHFIHLICRYSRSILEQPKKKRV